MTATAMKAAMLPRKSSAALSCQRGRGPTLTRYHGIGLSPARSTAPRACRRTPSGHCRPASHSAAARRRAPTVASDSPRHIHWTAEACRQAGCRLAAAPYGRWSSCHRPLECQVAAGSLVRTILGRRVTALHHRAQEIEAERHGQSQDSTGVERAVSALQCAWADVGDEPND